MPNQGIDIRISTRPPDLRVIGKQLRRVGNGPALRKRMVAGLKAGVKPALPAVKNSALALPSRGKKHTGLRRRMYKAIGSQVRTGGREAGVRIKLSRSTMGDQAGVAKATNNGSWRHPVYKRQGHPARWVRQSSTPHWFDRANQRAAPPVRRSLKKVWDDVEHDLRGSSQ